MKLILLPFCVALAALTAQPGAALPPLAQDSRVREGLIAVGMALEVSERCEAIAARKLRGLLFLRDLKADARARGYSDAQIDAFVEDEAEKAGLEAEARARLADLGAIDSDGGTYCAAGRALIASGGQAGKLLRD